MPFYRPMLVLCAAAIFIASGPQTASGSASPGINSYVDYIPTAAEYPAPLGGVVQRLADAVSASTQRSKAEPAKKTDATDKSRFSAIAVELSKLKLKIARGYQDELIFLQGYTSENLGEHRQALAFYDQSLALRSDNPIAAFRRGVMLIAVKNYTDALNQFKEIEWRSPSFHHEVNYEIADCLLHLNKKEEAIKYIEKAHQADPSFVPVLRLLVRMKTEMLETTVDPAARSQIEKQILSDLGHILEKNPEDRDTALIFGGLLLKFSDPLVDSDRLDRAATIARHFAEQSQYGDEKAVMLLFDSLLKKGDVDGAEKVLKEGLKKHPRSVQLQSGLKQLKIERGIEG